MDSELQLAYLKAVGLADRHRDSGGGTDCLAGDSAGAGHVHGNVGHCAGKTGGRQHREGDILHRLGRHAAHIVGQAAVAQRDILRQGQRDDDVVQCLVAVGGVKAQREGKGGARRYGVTIIGGADDEVRCGGLVFVHALAQRYAELLQRLAGIQVAEVDGQGIAAAVVDDIAEQQHITVIIVLGVLAGLVRVVVAFKQLTNFAGAGVSKDGRIDAGHNVFGLYGIPGRGMVHHLQHDVDLIAHV